MSNKVIGIGLPLLLGLVAGCAKAPQSSPQAQPSSSEPPLVTAPIHKAKDTAKDVQQKALEREQLNPEVQTQPSPDQ